LTKDSLQDKTKTTSLHAIKEEGFISMAKKKENYLQGAEKTENGLKFRGVILEPIVENCNGCERIVEFEGEKYCSSYPRPAAKWRNGACNFATHVKATIDKTGKVKLNPLKASKRAARGR